MQQAFTIGLVLSTSSILPIGKTFEKGLNNGLSVTDDLNVTVIKEFVDQGGVEAVDRASSKLINYEDADLVTGVVSSMVGYQIADRFEKSKKPFIINNLGEHLPSLEGLNSHLFINSTHYWQQAWAMGRWAVKQFGRNGAYAGAVYDSGYSFPSMVSMGMNSVEDQNQFTPYITPMPPAGEIADPKVIVDRLIHEQPDFVYAAFCGEEASRFLMYYMEAALHKHIPLLGCPFLIEDFENTNGEALEIYTGMSSYTPLKAGAIDHDFWATKDTFYLLGYETGMLIRASLMDKSDEPLNNKLAKARVKGSRGLVSADPGTLGSNNHVFLCKHIAKGNGAAVKREIKEELPTINITDPAMVETMGRISATWMNPYPGI